MRQAFVPASGREGNGVASKKRRRAVAAGDGEAVSAVYESIVRPGKTNSKRSTRREGEAGCRSSAAGVSPLLPPSPPSPLTGGAERTSHEAEGGGSPARPSAMFGPAPNPNLVHDSEESVEQHQPEEEGFFCHVCGERVKSVSEDKHNTSTLHIFNQKHRPQGREVQIHESNKGFQLLAGMGWKLDEGLGARKQGRVNPLQTTFKRGTTGLGAGEKLRPRVTHFPSHVPSQALNAPDGKSDAVRAQDGLDRRRRRRSTNSKSGGSGASGVVSNVASSSAVAGKSSRASWGGFWGQGTHPGSDSGTGGGAPSSRSGVSSSSRKGRSGGGFSRGGGGGGGIGKAGDGSFMSKKEREVQIEREKRKERRARFELLSDVPEEYAALFLG